MKKYISIFCLLNICALGFLNAQVNINTQEKMEGVQLNIHGNLKIEDVHKDDEVEYQSTIPLYLKKTEEGKPSNNIIVKNSSRQFYKMKYKIKIGKEGPFSMIYDTKIPTSKYNILAVKSLLKVLKDGKEIIAPLDMFFRNGTWAETERKHTVNYLTSPVRYVDIWKCPQETGGEVNNNYCIYANIGPATLNYEGIKGFTNAIWEFSFLAVDKDLIIDQPYPIKAYPTN